MMSRPRGHGIVAGGAVAAGASTLPGEATVLARLRAGDESMFIRVVDAWSDGMLRLARAHVSTDASAEDVVQDTWLAVIKGLGRFEGRSSVKTWVYRILVNTAKNRGMRESRTVPWTSVAAALDDVGPTVDPSRFQGRGDEYPGHWREPPPAWPSAESEAAAAEVRRQVEAALRELPYRQRAVMTLRDVEGCDAGEVCSVLGISAGNQRVLLHRARAAVRARLEDYFHGAGRETGAV
jgi:RNA polymerase sigma factor (sigma-70 family)